MRRKTNDKVVKFCVVCGDKAKGLNFNALTCQSCKAFFRRNALSNKEFKCSFTNSCDIDIVSRKFCSSCRLKKCFENGMKKEWILSEEEKLSIREKIMINRLRRGKLQCHNDLLLNASTPHSVASAATASVMPSTMDYLTKNQTDSQSSSSSSPSIIHSMNCEEHDNNSHNQVMNFKLLSSSFSPISSASSANPAASPPTTLLTSSSSNNLHLLHHHHHHHHAIDAVQQRFFAYNIKQFTPTIICGGQTNHDGYFSNHSNDPHQPQPQQSPIFPSEINQIDPMINVVGFLNSQPPPSSSIINAVDDSPTSNEFQSTITERVSCFPTPDTSLSNNKDNENHPELTTNKDYLRNFLANFNHKSFDFGTFPCIFNIDPLTELSVKLEQHVFQMFGGKNFTVKEKYKLKELALACSMLHNPYKRIVYLQTPGNVDSHCCVLAESCLHRMIAMSKRLTAFNSLSLDDQVVLLKFGLIEMFCLRTVLAFDPGQQTWTFVDDNCKLSALVYMDAVKPCCIGYDYRTSVTNFYSGFKHEWKTDNVIMDLLTAMVLFTERHGISAREQIREARIEFSELLKHYLEMKYPAAIDAHVSYDRLLLTVKAMQLLHQDLLHVVASTVGHSLDSPLMAQLTDHYQKQPQDDEHQSQCNIERLTIKEDVSKGKFGRFGSTAARSSSSTSCSVRSPTSDIDTSDINHGMIMDDVAIDHDRQTPNDDVQFLTIDDNRFCF